MDLDEDARPAGPDPAENDLSDETQDFRFLQSFALKADQPSLPRRGEKDFEPHGTRAQDVALAGARAAMHGALAVGRAHPPGRLPVCDLDPAAGGLCAVRKALGPHFRSVGRADRRGRVHLRPEEALFLLERGSLELRLAGRRRREGGDADRPVDGDGGDADGGRGASADGERDEDGDSDGDGNGLVLGLQSAYALLLGRDGLTLERFQVYAGLKRSGYHVIRAPSWDGRDWEPQRSPVAESTTSEAQGFLSWLRSQLAGATPPHRPMVAVGLYRSYADIYAQLPKVQRLAPGADSQLSPSAAPPSRSPVSICYHVWKPNALFKKSAPGDPDFQVAVISADAPGNEVLSPAQLDDLLATVDPRPPPASMANHPYQRLRHGQKHVILAIVDQGVVSYLRVADSDFGKERLYLIQRPPRGSWKKGGGNRGKGRSNR